MRHFMLRGVLTLSLLSAVSSAPAARAHGMGDEGEESPAKQAEAKAHKGAPKSFAEKPAVGTWATCPVSGETFQVNARTKFATYEGRTYAFCCPGCDGDFSANPGKYSHTEKTKT